MEDALQIGELLFKQKEIIKGDGGLFTEWAKGNLPFSVRTAQRYMKLFYYVDELRKKDIKTLTDAYAHINGEPITDEIVDADDSVKTSDIVVKTTVDIDELKFPKKKAKGRMETFHLTKKNVDDFIKGKFYRGCEGRYVKFVIQTESSNTISYRTGEFLSTAYKYLKTGGKIIFHKR